jgi:hypothetical protein
MVLIVTGPRYVDITSKKNKKHEKGILELEWMEVKKVEASYKFFSRVFALVLLDLSRG